MRPKPDSMKNTQPSSRLTERQRDLTSMGMSVSNLIAKRRPSASNGRWHAGVYQSLDRPDPRAANLSYSRQRNRLHPNLLAKADFCAKQRLHRANSQALMYQVDQLLY
jgi:hypothetical protein